ncbi:MAG: phosphotransferase [Pseudomonadota bacterium]
MDTALKIWIQAQLESCSSIQSPPSLLLEPLCGDAGFRQYFQLNTQPRLIAVSAPATEGNSESAAYFAQLAAVLRQQGIPVPQVLACDAQQNFLLLEHLGNQDFLAMLNPDSADLLYGEALTCLLRLQQILPEHIQLPTYDRSLLRTEMNLFAEWFVAGLLNYSPSNSEQGMIDRAFRFLEEQALEQPKVVVHRDFHSRNLMYREGKAPGIIDFQDAVWGPVTYDLVSLLRDCYIQWPQEKVYQWAIGYGNLLLNSGVIAPVSEAQWLRWFDTMGLQRHIKVLGIFSRLQLRDAKPRYLDDLSLTWHYTLSVAKCYREMHSFVQWCEDCLLPIIEKQDWYRPLENMEPWA